MAHATRELRERLLALGVGVARRVVVVDLCTSTQDLAASESRGEPGLMVVGLRQTAGRGRLGRAWHDSGRGLAATFVLGGETEAGRLSLAAGVAALAACASMIAGERRLGIRWPNDVVERTGGRKLAGVLIERRGGVFLAGIGINVTHAEGDWPAELAGRACSIAQVGGQGTVADAAAALAVALEAALARTPGELVEAWKAGDVLRGTTRTFVHDGRQVRGVVESVEPTSEIVVRLAEGRLERLPALTTSLRHDDR